MTVVRKLGAGGFGDVYEVITSDGLRVAQKVFRPSADSNVDNDDLKARFRREIKYQGNINSPNVVRIISSNLENDPPYFNMELGVGSLADELALDRTLSANPNKALFDILAGLDVLHSLGFSHRDLKPHNVIKFLDFEGPRYALSDFGLMNVGGSATSSLTTSNMAGGSERWSAPECMINFKRANYLADIYSFGAILHDIFEGTNRLPFSELTGSGPVGSVIERCTKTVPHRRFSNVSDLREALFTAVSTQPFQTANNEEANVLDLLNNNSTLSDKEWDEVYRFIDNNGGDWRRNANIFQSLSRDHLRDLHQNWPPLFNALGVEFCEYASSGVFSFDYCDVIGGKAEILYELGDTNLKAHCAVAMLRLGSSHNRWYVQRLFVTMAGTEIFDGLAKRIAIEIDIRNLDFKRMFSQTESTISATRQQLHHIVAGLLDK
ncbi:serine/threonine-protein kinase [uncultured Sphingomonas sp.]|uniref:serine/threonine-protein kinase n=1 Tax=uncultured Sphingomonas sp. TaxID=158754 RepID=UPI003748DF75